MNWKLIIVGCLILTLLFTIITVSVLSSFQLQNNNSAHVQKIQAGISGEFQIHPIPIPFFWIRRGKLETDSPCQAAGMRF